MPASVAYVPHGGGPLPLLGEPGHDSLARFLRGLGEQLPRPSAIVVISAHWESHQVSVTAAPAPGLLYDYYGFPDAAYSLRYPAPGDPALAERLAVALEQGGHDVLRDDERDFDHGVFVPLSLMYPQADIPCVQVSLLASLDAGAHVRLGESLAALADEPLLFLGSGMSYHNLGVLLGRRVPQPADADRQFHQWLDTTCCDDALAAVERLQRLADWQHAPGARQCHPREEHLLPLHVCAGVARGAAAQRLFSEPLMGQQVSAYRW